jgi:hypothetical protein
MIIFAPNLLRGPDWGSRAVRRKLRAAARHDKKIIASATTKDREAGSVKARGMCVLRHGPVLAITIYP